MNLEADVIGFTEEMPVICEGIGPHRE